MLMSADQNSLPGSPISLRRFNIARPRDKVRQTFCGKVRAFHTISVLEWSYLALSFIGLAASLGLTVEKVTHQETDTSDFTFAILLLFTITCCFYYVADAVLTERADELMVFVISNIIVFIYCIANYVTQVDARNDLKLTRLVIVCVLSGVLIPSGFYQCYKYVRSNHLVFNTVGAITELQKACKIYYLCSSLLKFDLQLQLSMLILVMGDEGTSMNKTQKFVLGYGVLFTLIFVITGYVALCQENRILMLVFFVLGLSEPGFIAYKFYFAAEYYKDSSIYESTFACGCFALVVWLALMFFTGYYTKYCFCKGLNEKMFGYFGKSAPKQPTDQTASADSIITSTSSVVQSNSMSAEPVAMPPPLTFEDVFPPSPSDIVTVEVHGELEKY